MGGKTATTTQSVQIPEEVLARYNAVNARAEAAAAQGFQPYQGQFVAGMTGSQLAGMQNINQASGMAQPYYQQAAGYTTSGAQNVGRLTAQDIQQYYNPFTESVINPTMQALREQQGQERSGAIANAIRQGAFGGDRSGIGMAQLARQQNLASAMTEGQLRQGAYNQAVQTAAGQQGVVASDLARQMQAGQQMAALGTGSQAAALQGGQAQMAAGLQQQQTQQADLTARYQQFLQERGFPYQQAQFLANIAMGTGALSGSTTTTTQPAPFFSDRRLKHDVKEIGETKDGLPIYSFKYNGDNRTQIGLMAQDVEKKKPEAVGLAAGFKTVDYERATKGSSRKERQYGGGLFNSAAPMGVNNSTSLPSMNPGLMPQFPSAPTGMAPLQPTASQAQMPGLLSSAQDFLSQKGIDISPAVSAVMPQYNQPNALGAASMGGAVGPQNQAQGYASGGLVTSPEWLAKYMRGLDTEGPGVYGAKGTLGSGVPGGNVESGVPAAKLPVPKLLQAKGEVKKITPVFGQAMNAYNTGKGIANTLGGLTTTVTSPGSGGKEGSSGLLAGLDVRTLEKLANLLGRAPSNLGGAREGDDNNFSTDASSGVIPGLPGSSSGADPLTGVVKEGMIDINKLPKPGQENSNVPKPPAPGNELAAGLGLAKGLLGLFTMFSDERAKDNIRQVGELYNGEPVFAYNKLGGPTEIGLIAQEVLQRDPEAVIEMPGGLLGVDYDLAVEMPEESGIGLGAAVEAYRHGGAVGRHGYATDGGVNPEEEYPTGGGQGWSDDLLPGAIRATAERIGVNPLDLATAISFETAGTFDPWKKGPTTKWGEHRGLIQWGTPQRQQYGVTEDTPVPEQMKAVGRYLQDRGVKPGMGLLDIYSAINAGRVGKYSASDEPAGGAPGNVAQKVAGMGDHRGRAALFISEPPEQRDALGAIKTATGAKDTGSYDSSTDVRAYAPTRGNTGLVPSGKYTMTEADLGGTGVPATTDKPIPPRDIPEPGLVTSSREPTAAPEPRPGVVPASIGKWSSVGDVADRFLPEGVPTSSRFWAPTLSFLGSMLSSKSPYLAGAIGEGLVGGVAGYQANLKNQAQAAKGIIDLVNDRFTLTQDPKTEQRAFFDANTNSFVTPQQRLQIIAALAKSYGVDPRMLGLPASSASVPAPAPATAPVAAPRQPAAIEPPKAPGAGEVPSPVPAGAEPPVKTAQGPQVPPAQPVAEPKTFADINIQAPVYKEISEMKADVIANPTKYGLDKNTSQVLSDSIKKIERLRKKEEQLSVSKSTLPQAAAARAERQNIEQRVDKMLADATARRAKDIENEQARVNTSYTKYKGLMQESLSSIPEKTKLLDIMADMAAGMKTGRFANTVETARQLAKAVGFDPSNWKSIRDRLGFGNLGEYDTLMKASVKQAFDQVAENNMGRAPKAALQEALLTVPGPGMDPDAVVRLIGVAKAAVKYEENRAKSFLSQKGAIDPAKFELAEAKFAKKELERYKGNAYKTMKYSKYVSGDLRRKLEEDYGKYPKIMNKEEFNEFSNYPYLLAPNGDKIRNPAYKGAR